MINKIGNWIRSWMFSISLKMNHVCTFGYELKQCFSTGESRPIFGSQALTFGSSKPVFQYYECNKWVAYLCQISNVESHWIKWLSYCHYYVFYYCKSILLVWGYSNDTIYYFELLIPPPSTYDILWICPDQECCLVYLNGLSWQWRVSSTINQTLPH